MKKKYPLTDQEKKATDSASVVLTRGGLDPLTLMNEFHTWDEPPPDRVIWYQKKLAAACEIAVGFCKMANNYKEEIKRLEKKIRQLEKK